MFQDIETQIINSIKHEQGEPLDRDSHTISFAEDSLLGRIAVNGSGRVRVNTHHHQAVKTLGKDLKATAWANDGVIEGIEDSRTDRFVVGVQWHPELAWKNGASARLFKVFVEKCALRMVV